MRILFFGWMPMIRRPLQTWMAISASGRIRAVIKTMPPRSSNLLNHKSAQIRSILTEIKYYKWKMIRLMVYKTLLSLCSPNGRRVQHGETHWSAIMENQVWVGRSARLTETLERQDLPFGGQRVMTTLLHRIPIKPVFLSVLIIVKIPTLGSSGIMVHKPIPSQTKE